MENKKQTSLNLITSLLAFVINVGINFKLTPYMIGKLGNEAYGFIGLAYDFVNYASILTMALNTMSSRFISVEYHRGNKKKAQSYVNSILVGNLIIAFAIGISAIFIVWKLQYLINIPDYLMTDVKITFATVFVNFILSTIISVLSCPAFVMNRMDKIYFRNMVSYILKLVVTVLLISLFNVKIYFISITAVFCTCYLGIANYVISKKIMPDISFIPKSFKMNDIKEILSSGVWMSLLSVSNLLLSGLNSLLTNKFIGTVENGYLSVSKSIPSYIGQLGQQLGQVFAPSFTYLYAKGQIEELLVEAKRSLKIMGLIMIVPVAGFIVFGTEFYSLWVPNYTHSELTTIQTLSILSTIPFIINALIYPLIQINNALKKVKIPVIAVFIIGFINILCVFPLGILGKLTLNILTGVNSVLQSTMLLIFHPLYTAKILNKKWTTFYPTLLRSFFCFVFMTIIFYTFKDFFVATSWLKFLISAVVYGIIGYAISFFIIFDVTEYKTIINMFKSKINKK